MAAIEKTIRIVLGAALVMTHMARPAAAQTYVGDARRIAMSNMGEADIVDSDKSQNERSYHRIGLPLGLIQVFKDYRAGRLDSSSASFDPTILLEDLSN